MASPTDSKPCSETADDIEIRATPAEVAAQRQAAKLRAVPPEDYLAFLAQFASSGSYESLRSRKGPRGEPFRLQD